MKHASILTFAFSLLFASAASAGGVIIYYKESDTTAAARPAPDGVSTFNPADPHGQDGVGPLPGLQGFDRTPFALESADAEAEAEAAELEAMGCGGATAAAGPAGLLPLLVSGLALLRRRR